MNAHSTSLEEQKEKANTIIRIVSDYFCIKNLMQRTRKHAVIYGRQVAIYLVKETTTLTLREIGQLFDGRDHKTIEHAFKEFKGFIDVYCETQKDLDNIRKILIFS